MMGAGGDVGGGLGGLIGSIAVLAGAGGKGGDAYYKKALEVWEKLKDPEFDMRELTAPELKIFATYFPEQYQAFVPEDIKQVVDSPELRASQLRGLARMEQMSREGLPLSERIAAQEAGRTVSSELGRANQAVLSDLAARGRLGAGDEIAGRMIGNQGEAELARALGSDLATQSEANRWKGLLGATETAGAIRGQDVDVSRANAQIMNDMNQFIANLRTTQAQENAAARERAGFANTEQRQRVGESNTLAQYGTQLENLERKNRLRSLLSDYQMRKASGLAGAYGSYGLKKDQDKAAREAAIMSAGRGLGQAAGGGGTLLGLF